MPLASLTASVQLDSVPGTSAPASFLKSLLASRWDVIQQPTESADEEKTLRVGPRLSDTILRIKAILQLTERLNTSAGLGVFVIHAEVALPQNW